MKCSVILSTLLITASAHAATLSLQWQGQPGIDRISLSPSSSAVIDVVLELGSRGGDGVSGVFFSMEAGPVEHLANFTNLTGWSASNESDSVGLPFGQSQFAAGSSRPGSPDDLRGTGTIVIGSFVIHFNDLVSPVSQEFEVAFDANANNQLVGSDGSFYSLTADQAYVAYSGYWTYGKGSPGLTQMMNTIARDPLIIIKPEPGSLALLGLAGLAILFRRTSTE